jgi:glucose-1-phosphate thymidylyltransferase
LDEEDKMTKNKHLVSKQSFVQRLIGIIPAAGKGTHVAPLPGSKELFPVGFGEIEMEGEKRHYPKVVSQYLVDQMVIAGAEQIYMVISEGKWDILRYYGSGKRFGAHIVYLMVEEMIGMPYTINTAFPLVKDATVLFGMPDTIFRPGNAFSLLLDQHKRHSADLTLGLFATDQPWRFGMVGYDDEYRLATCTDKPAQTHLNFMWGNACWGPAFSELLNNGIQAALAGGPNKREIVLGDYFQEAAEIGLNVRVYPFEQGEYVDIGSPKDLVRAVRQFAQLKLDQNDEIIF